MSSESTDSLETPPVIDKNPALQQYYGSPESRIDYRLVLGGTRHFSYYSSPRSFPLPIDRALRRMGAKLLEALSLPLGSRVLDAGCGVGYVALYISRKGGMSVTGIDVVDRHIAKAKRNIAEAKLPAGQEVTVQKMDYHYLEPLPEVSYEGFYTMETFVHATDPEAVMAQFYRVLKSGGRLVLFEYDYEIESDHSSVSTKLTRTMRDINKYAAMPTNTHSNAGMYKVWLEAAGFVNVEVRDISSDIRPMLRLFWAMAVMPYFLICQLGLRKHFINTVTGYHGYLGQQYWRYLTVMATKLGPPIEAPKTLHTRLWRSQRKPTQPVQACSKMLSVCTRR